MKNLNPREIDILNILWNSENPLIASAIVNASNGILTQSTVTTVLRNLLKRKLVEVADIAYSGKVLSRAYRPTPLSREYLLHHFTESYQAFNHVISSVDMASAIINLDNNSYSTEEKQTLINMLNEYSKGCPNP